MYRCDLCALCFDNKWWPMGQTTCSHDHDVYQMPHMTSVQRTESIEWVEKPSCRWVVLSLSSHQEKGWCIGHSHLVWSNCMWIVYVYVCVCVFSTESIPWKQTLFSHWWASTEGTLLTESSVAVDLLYWVISTCDLTALSTGHQISIAKWRGGRMQYSDTLWILYL